MIPHKNGFPRKLFEWLVLAQILTIFSTSERVLSRDPDPTGCPAAQQIQAKPTDLERDYDLTL